MGILSEPSITGILVLMIITMIVGGMLWIVIDWCENKGDKKMCNKEIDIFGQKLYKLTESLEELRQCVNKQADVIIKLKDNEQPSPFHRVNAMYWISVDRRMPKDGERVMVVVDMNSSSNQASKYAYVSIGNHCCTKGWLQSNDTPFAHAKITHWCPIPAMPHE